MNIKQIIKTLIPSKKVSTFVLIIASLGIISGTIFLLIINPNDKNIITNEITTFINNINTNNINNVQALKNSIFNNYSYIILIFILGLSLIGSIINIFITYIKGFVIGFSISSLIYTYGIKGIILCFLYIIPIFINLFLIILLTTYTIILSKYLYILILGNRNTGFKSYLKKYLIIFISILIISIITSLIEAFLTPVLFKLVIKLFI